MAFGDFQLEAPVTAAVRIGVHIDPVKGDVSRRLRGQLHVQPTDLDQRRVGRRGVSRELEADEGVVTRAVFGRQDRRGSSRRLELRHHGRRCGTDTPSDRQGDVVARPHGDAPRAIVSGGRVTRISRADARPDRGSWDRRVQRGLRSHSRARTMGPAVGGATGLLSTRRARAGVVSFQFDPLKRGRERLA